MVMVWYHYPFKVSIEGVDPEIRSHIYGSVKILRSLYCSGKIEVRPYSSSLGINSYLEVAKTYCSIATVVASIQEYRPPVCDL